MNTAVNLAEIRTQLDQESWEQDDQEQMEVRDLEEQIGKWLHRHQQPADSINRSAMTIFLFCHPLTSKESSRFARLFVCIEKKSPVASAKFFNRS